ncbi:unnamed protein product [Brassicogethes aeneus]|uniref:Translation initiation factor eIF2B subunit beta n=1 Tax=Brassicogethes aeneus TaxID=1431903 RepID=A0A9P0B3P6_BRAAE|nr:unnamed protein product [Brassicogethes aeneus]
MTHKEDLSDINKLISDIKQKKLITSYEIALKTEEIVEALISKRNWKHADELMDLIKLCIKFCTECLPQEATATNIMRHILKVIREEFEVVSKKKTEIQSLHQLVTANPNDVLDYTTPLKDLKMSLLDHLSEYKVELETSTDNIATQAAEHIHTNEIILTVGKSNLVEKFLKNAAKKRSINVIVLEQAPLYQGHEMAARLAKANIQTTIIPDSAVFAMMSRVNKVIIGTHTVLANGGLRAASGVHSIALAAKRYSVPVMVLSHMYKFSPIYSASHKQEAFNVMASPANVLPYSSGPILNKVQVLNPVFDYVPPELVTLFISHQGGNAPSYVYRLLSELYHQDDYYL